MAPGKNDGSVFDRLPATAADRQVDGRATREDVVAFWADRYGVDPGVFDGHTFWERGAGKVWVCAAAPPTPVAVEGLGMTCLRTRQEHWKPTTDAAQRFGAHATENVLVLEPGEAARYARGEDQDLPRWDGDWGYVLVARELAGDRVVLGVGLYLHDELRSVVPKGRRRELASDAE